MSIAHPSRHASTRSSGGPSLFGGRRPRLSRVCACGDRACGEWFPHRLHQWASCPAGWRHRIHAACCGPNVWTAHKGSCTVFINGRPAHRVSDSTRHCGGMGRLIEGSHNVFVGGGSCSCGGRADWPPPAPPNVTPKEPDPKRGRLRVKVVDDQGRSMANEPYDVTLPDGSKRSGVTDAQGRISLDGIAVGSCQVKLPKRDSGDVRPK